MNHLTFITNHLQQQRTLQEGEEISESSEPPNPGTDTSRNLQSPKVSSPVEKVRNSPNSKTVPTNQVAAPVSSKDESVPASLSVPVSTVGVTSSNLRPPPEVGPKQKVAQIIFDAPAKSYCKKKDHRLIS